MNERKCKHRWIATFDIEGGLKENPGVWATKGTGLVIKDHCQRCGLKRKQVLLGSQRNPGEKDTIEYYREDFIFSDDE